MESVNKIKGLSISGRALNTMIALVGEHKEEVKKIFKFHKLSDTQGIGEFHINPDEWYDLDRYLISMKEIESKIGEENLSEVATKTILYAPFLPIYNDIFTSLKSLNRAYYLNLSKDGINPIYNDEDSTFTKEAGEFQIETIKGLNRIECISSSCFPTSYETGLILGFAQKFETSALVKLDSNPHNKKNGFEKNHFIITWHS